MRAGHIKSGEYDFALDQVTQVWQSGSIITGLLMDVTTNALKADAELSEIEVLSTFQAGGVDCTVRLKVAAPVISASLFARFKSLDSENSLKSP